jgi:hypothetical protein
MILHLQQTATHFILYLHKPTVTSEAKGDVSPVAAVCIYLFECVECVGGRKIRTEYFLDKKQLILLSNRIKIRKG